MTQTVFERLDAAICAAATDELIAAAQAARTTYPNDEPVASNLAVLLQVLPRVRDIVVGRRPVAAVEPDEQAPDPA